LVSTLQSKVAALEKHIKTKKEQNDQILVALERDLQKKEQMISALQKQGVHKVGEQTRMDQLFRQEKQEFETDLGKEKSKNDELNEKVKKYE